MFLFRLQNYIFFLFTAIFYSLFSIFWKTWEQKNMFFWKTWEQKNKFFWRHENRRTCFIPQPKNMFFCSPVLPLASNPHVLLFSCLIPRKQSPCSHVLLSSPKNMFFCLITMHIFLIPIKILNCFSLPFQISFILLYINILSLRNIENSIYTFYRNGTSTL